MNPTPPKPPADALPDVKALCERASFAFQLLTDDNYHSEAHVVSDLKAALERLVEELATREHISDVHVEERDEAYASITQLETSLRSSEAALAEARRENDEVYSKGYAAANHKHSERRKVDHAVYEENEKLRAELTALRANAQEDSRLLDWLEVNKGRCGYSEQTYIGEGYFAHEYTQGDKYEAAPTLRDAIRAAMPAPSGQPAKLAPPPTTASGGEENL